MNEPDAHGWNCKQQGPTVKLIPPDKTSILMPAVAAVPSTVELHSEVTVLQFKLLNQPVELRVPFYSSILD